jgi:hypothetical protein
MNSKEQAIEIARLVNQIRDYLTKPSTVDFFKANEAMGAALVSSTAGIKSRLMVLYGLKAKVETTTDFLPTNEELLAGKVQGWLSPGDIIAGWIDYLADQPRVVVAAELNGYTWRWFDSEEVRGPGLGQMKTDPWLQSHGWIKLEGSTLEEIEAEQASEIAQLSGLLNYFRNKEFLN